jgi:ribonuclease P protein component
MRDRHLTLVYEATGAPGGARLALVVPRRCGNAVKRNRIRRILKEEARLAPNVRAMPFDMALCWKGPITEEAARHAHREAASLLRKFADGSQCSPKPPSQPSGSTS